MTSLPVPPIRVGLLNDAACTDPPSREACWEVLVSAPGLAVRRIPAADIREGGLGALDVLVIPGGTGGGQAKTLGVEGGKRITDFVASGGGVVAICAGGYLVVNGWNPETRAIELLDALSWDDEHWARGEGWITVQVLGVDDAQSSRTMWFQNGPIFVPRGLDSIPDYVPLVRYVTDMAPKGAPTGLMTGRDAVIAGPFGQGRVVAFGPHPERSPGLHHWLVNAVRWVAAAKGSSVSTSPPTARSVLEGP